MCTITNSRPPAAPPPAPGPCGMLAAGSRQMGAPLATLALAAASCVRAAAPHSHSIASAAAAGNPAPPCSDWPQSCPGTVPRAPYRQTWQMNLSTIIQPCNDTGFRDPETTKGWGIVDFDWSNSKGTGTADGW